MTLFLVLFEAESSGSVVSINHSYSYSYQCTEKGKPKCILQYVFAFHTHLVNVVVVCRPPGDVGLHVDGVSVLLAQRLVLLGVERLALQVHVANLHTATNINITNWCKYIT